MLHRLDTTDFTKEDKNITIKAGDTKGCLDVPITNDQTQESQEFFDVQFSLLGAGLPAGLDVVLRQPVANITIIDDDGEGINQPLHYYFCTCVCTGLCFS